MARRKFSKEEVEQWRKEYNQSVFYINKNDSNLFVPRRYSFGWTINLAHPGAWLIYLAIIALTHFRIFRKAILG